MMHNLNLMKLKSAAKRIGLGRARGEREQNKLLIAPDGYISIVEEEGLGD